jgi:hypothetical protein
MKIRRLSKAQKQALFKTIRYSHLLHEELIETSKNPLFSNDPLVKDLIMQGLSHRLNPYEKTAEDKYQIELNPRPTYTKKPAPRSPKPEEKKSD